VIFENIKKETELINKLIFYFLGNITYTNTKSYIDECINNKDKILQAFDNKKTNQKNYYNIINNISFWIDIHNNNNISLKKTLESTITLIKKNIKKNIDSKALQQKIKQNDINDLYERLTISKFFTWLL